MIILNTVEKNNPDQMMNKFKVFINSNTLGKKKSSLSKAPYIPEEEDKTPLASNTNDQSIMYS